MAWDPELEAHREWLGYLQPVGLVVSPHALIAASAVIDRNIGARHRQFIEALDEIQPDPNEDAILAITDFPTFVRDILEWDPAFLLGSPGAEPLPETLAIHLEAYGETLRPTFAVREIEAAADAPNPWLMLIETLSPGTDLDTPLARESHQWEASPQARFERLLRGLEVPTGLLTNGTHLRLVYAPRGENSGHLTFPVAAMAEVAGRSIFAALHLLLAQDRLFALPTRQRLPFLLAESRRYQNLVSTRLAVQMLAALYELLRGFQAANEKRRGELLREVLAAHPDRVYEGLLTVLLRLIFTLYTEERGLLPGGDVFVRHYSVGGLFERLRDEAGRFPDTMDHRYGAWSQLLALFKLLHDGGSHGALSLPARHGHLFDPDRFPFLDGGGEVPLVSDGVVHRVLTNLLVLDGERLSYRTLDVEQIGSVYETMMGFTLMVTKGRSLAVKPTKAHGAPAVIDLEELLRVPGKDRGKWVRERTDQEIGGEGLTALKSARTPEEAEAAIGRKVSREATPQIAPKGTMLLQPSDERRRSGSHYTPRALTEPIVREALRPVLAGLGPQPTPAQILDLNICDIAMGSGAFLVETDRQLAEILVAAWHAHDALPADIPPDEDELLHAKRLVAKRCLYGVDRNPMAVDLAKLSLWLATLARDHAFTFLDHNLRHGDSLVGLTREQIAAFHWEPGRQVTTLTPLLTERLKKAERLRAKIEEAPDSTTEKELRRLLIESSAALDDVRLAGDLVVEAFLSEEKPKNREEARQRVADEFLGRLQRGGDLESLRNRATAMRAGEFPIHPFHWEIEFPDVYGQGSPGFDAIVGNPPFAGVTSLAESNANYYTDWLREMNPGSGGKSDLVAFFFRRANSLIKDGGCAGLIATNTIAQGDTRRSGLGEIVRSGSRIYHAVRRLQWPGEAAVIISVVHFYRGVRQRPFVLDGKMVINISPFLLPSLQNDEPIELKASSGVGFLGTKVQGIGFVFDDSNPECPSLSLLETALSKNPKCGKYVRPYIGGEELNTMPKIFYPRQAIDFGESDEESARRCPQLMSIVEHYVLPQRRGKPGSLGKRWWQYGHRASELYRSIEGLKRVLAVARVSRTAAFTFIPTGGIINDKIIVLRFDSTAALALFQSRVHEIWARTFSGTLKDDLQYTPSDCLTTFPFPSGWEESAVLGRIGNEYYEFRAALMVKNDEGLTKTYNRFHDPEETSADILRLHELHAAMDRAVLDAYGWTDIQPQCEFLLDYEEEEDETVESRGRRRKKPWRYRWPDEIRDEVLARLLDLNRQRAEEERRPIYEADLAADNVAPEYKPRKPSGRPRKDAAPEGQGGLF